jgi:hypothetical protein
MADIFIALKTEDTPRVQSIYDGFTSRGLTVFWSNDIQKGAPNYQAIIKEELLKAAAVVAVWTNRSVHCGPVIQEASQAERGKKLFQFLIDDIEPIDMPMEVGYKSQKTVLRGLDGDGGRRSLARRMRGPAGRSISTGRKRGRPTTRARGAKPINVPATSPKIRCERGDYAGPFLLRRLDGPPPFFPTSRRLSSAQASISGIAIIVSR